MAEPTKTGNGGGNQPSAGEAKQTKVRVLGQSLEEAPLRHGLETALRQMAHLETDRRKKIELVDRANRVRPVTWV